jgi:negative regulator of flagellin synthesis FlgM
MQISGHGKADHLAKLLLGMQDVGATGARQASPRKEAGNDEVHISERAQELRRIQSLAHEPDPARVAHLDRIKQALDNGNYDVSGRKVGDALIKNVLTESIL